MKAAQFQEIVELSGADLDAKDCAHPLREVLVPLDAELSSVRDVVPAWSSWLLDNGHPTAALVVGWYGRKKKYKLPRWQELLETLDPVPSASALDEASFWSELAQKHKGEKKFRESVPAWRASARIADGFTSHFQIGYACSQLKAYAPGEAAYRTSIERHPKTAAAYNNLANLVWDDGRFEEAEPLYQQSIANNNKYASGLFSYGSWCKKAGRYQEAVDLYRRAIAIDASDLDDFRPLGDALYALDRYKEAEEAYRRALEGGVTGLLLNKLGLSLYYQDKDSEAVVLFRRAIEKMPNDASPWNNLGLALRYSGHPEESETSFLRAISMRSGYALYHRNLGNLYKAEERYSEAETQFLTSLDLSPGDWRVCHALRMMYSAVGRHDDAISVMKYYLREKPEGNPHEAYRRLGWTYLAQERFPEAIEAFEQGLTHAPGTLACVCGLIDAYSLQGDRSNAQKFMAQATKIDKKSAWGPTNIAEMYLREGDLKDAERYFRKAIKLNENWTFALYGLAQVCCQTERYSEALSRVDACLARSSSTYKFHQLKGDILLAMGRYHSANLSYIAAHRISMEDAVQAALMIGFS